MTLTWFRVKVAEHAVAGRYAVPEGVFEVRAASEGDARLRAVREAQIRVRVPPWKPYRRESWSYTRAEEFVPLSEAERILAQARRREAEEES